jgi:protein-tyrosine phosphatase
MTSANRKHQHLNWDGCFNARDLGGLPTISGQYTRSRSLVRTDSLDSLTEAGCAALYDYGIRTVIDLRNDDERQIELQKFNQYGDLTVLHLPHDGLDNIEFWNAFEAGPQYGGTPLYYQAHLEKMPERSSRVIAAIANAPPGGVLFHCVAGRDRTGLIAILILNLLGVPVEHIVSDYEVSDERLRVSYENLGQRNPSPFIKQYLADRGTTAGDIIIRLLGTFDTAGQLRDGGLSDAHLDALRRRLLTNNPEV